MKMYDVIYSKVIRDFIDLQEAIDEINTKFFWNNNNDAKFSNVKFVVDEKDDYNHNTIELRKNMHYNYYEIVLITIKYC